MWISFMLIDFNMKEDYIVLKVNIPEWLTKVCVADSSAPLSPTSNDRLFQ